MNDTISQLEVSQDTVSSTMHEETFFNPYVCDVSENMDCSSEIEFHSVKGGSLISFNCDSCDSTFSKREYLNFHCEVFHNISQSRSSNVGSRSIKRNLHIDFVSEGEELITTFVKRGVRPSTKKKTK